VVVCVSGSAAVFNSELYSAFLPPPRIVAVSGTRMTRAQVKDFTQRTHPGSNVTRVVLGRDPEIAAIVTMAPGPNSDQRFIDPYTGRDLGTARPFGLRMVSFFSQLHMALLLGYTGRIANGIGGVLVALLSITGMVIWWPGIRRWRASLSVRRTANFKKLNWDLHSAIGFWTFGIVFMWALTGAYLVFPAPVVLALHYAPSLSRLVDVHALLHSVHVGDFAGWPFKALWVVLGLTPPVLFVTGFIMWWHRVLNPWLKRGAAERASAKEPSLAITGRIFEPQSMRQL